MRRAFGLLHALVRSAAEVLAPSRCAACDAPLGAPGLFCTACDEPRARPLVDRLPSGVLVIALGGYEGSLARAVQRLKYGSRPDLGESLGVRLAEVFRAEAPFAPEVVVPIPLHPRRLADRGYNQSALVARAMARALRVPAWPLGLQRIRHTQEQASLGRSERLRNVANAFAAREPLEGRRVLVVDDVVTTGATVQAAADALLAAGALGVAVTAVLRADRQALP